MVHWKMDCTDSSPSKIIRDHTLPQTQSTMGAAITCLSSGRLGSTHGNQEAISLQVIHIHMQSMPRNMTCSTHQDGSSRKDMQEQQEDLSGLSRNQNIDKPKHQGNINTDGKSQEIMHMQYNLIYKMATTNGRCY